MRISLVMLKKKLDTISLVTNIILALLKMNKKSKLIRSTDSSYAEEKVAELYPNSPLSMDVDDILISIGEFGRSQKLLLLALSLLMIPAAYQSLLITFIGINPPWSCANLSTECNRTGVFSLVDKFYDERCSMKREVWRYNKEIKFSIVTEVSISIFILIIRTLHFQHSLKSMKNCAIKFL